MGKPRPLQKSGLKPAPKESGPKAPKSMAPKSAAAKPSLKAKPAEARSAPVANGKPRKTGVNGELRTSANVGLPSVQVRPTPPEVVIPETPPPLPSPIASFTF
jgi:hypothetical protein